LLAIIPKRDSNERKVQEGYLAKGKNWLAEPPTDTRFQALLMYSNVVVDSPTISIFIDVGVSGSIDRKFWHPSLRFLTSSKVTMSFADGGKSMRSFSIEGYRIRVRYKWGLCDAMKIVSVFQITGTR